ncbi:hypothetical protein B0T21DRAFT_40276 [Apiosordaria backusii]|uniref:Uncharacterized protein n=1 Tax=Apiosordaria backusii TaxID=314023 RepID=A0AA40AXB5_9PEZI|nr:hypothetical protein B0T21DRAFT_40276 [Apiosordaria backusii]
MIQTLLMSIFLAVSLHVLYTNQPSDDDLSYAWRSSVPQGDSSDKPPLAARLIERLGLLCQGNILHSSGAIFVSDITAADGPVHTPTLRIIPKIHLALLTATGAMIPDSKYRNASPGDTSLTAKYVSRVPGTYHGPPAHQRRVRSPAMR